MKRFLTATVLSVLFVSSLCLPFTARCESCDCEAKPLKQVRQVKTVSNDAQGLSKDMYLVSFDWAFDCKGVITLDEMGLLPHKGSITFLSDKSELSFCCAPGNKKDPSRLCKCGLRPKGTGVGPLEELDLGPEWVPWHRYGTETAKFPHGGDFKPPFLRALSKHGFHVHSFRDEEYLIWQTPFTDVCPERSPERTQLAVKFLIYDGETCGKDSSHTVWYLIYFAFREKRSRDEDWDYHGPKTLGRKGFEAANTKFHEVINTIKRQLTGRE